MIYDDFDSRESFKRKDFMNSLQTMKERSREISIHMDMLKAQLKAAEEEKQTIRLFFINFFFFAYFIVYLFFHPSDCY